jgi:UDP-N-acetyl-D-glucosamine dehydrogenase
MTHTATQQLTIASELEQRLKARTACVGIIGLGYVGLPLAVEFAQAGFSVTGFEVSLEKIRQINTGESYVQDVSTEAVASLRAEGRLRATSGFRAIESMDTINICVPTPLRKTKDPDMTYVVSACQEVARYLHPGMLIILESTTYPGTTEELLLPMFQSKGLKVGVDFFLCFSPERVDPGNPKYRTSNIPKIVGGVTPACTAMGQLFYSQAIETVVPVNSARVAEVVKLLENTFRMINIGLANEMAIMCDRMNIDVWEVIDAAATKPFGFMPFYPGPGLGGHCIPIDPYYLSWKSKQAGVEARFIELAGQINSNMPHFVVNKVMDALNEVSKPVRGSHIHVMGVAYKENIDDARESPALDIIHLLRNLGAKITYTDPYIRSVSLADSDLISAPQTVAAQADCTLITTAHRDYDLPQLLADSMLIIDTRNAMKGFSSPKIVRL